MDFAPKKVLFLGVCPHGTYMWNPTYRSVCTEEKRKRGLLATAHGPPLPFTDDGQGPLCRYIEGGKPRVLLLHSMREGPLTKSTPSSEMIHSKYYWYTHTYIYSWIACQLEVGTPIIIFAVEVQFQIRDQFCDCL